MVRHTNVPVELSGWLAEQRGSSGTERAVGATRPASLRRCAARLQVELGSDAVRGNAGWNVGARFSREVERGCTIYAASPPFPHPWRRVLSPSGSAIPHRPVGTSDQAPSSHPPSPVGNPHRSRADRRRGLQEGTTAGRSHWPRPTRLITSLRLIASRSPNAKVCALPPRCGPARHPAEPKAADESAAQRGCAGSQRCGTDRPHPEAGCVLTRGGRMGNTRFRWSECCGGPART
jgi:hypothetical protein